MKFYTTVCKYFIYIHCCVKTKITGIYTFTFSLLCETIHGFETKTAPGFLHSLHCFFSCTVVHTFHFLHYPRKGFYAAAAFYHFLIKHFNPQKYSCTLLCVLFSLCFTLLCIFLHCSHLCFKLLCIFFYYIHLCFALLCMSLYCSYLLRTAVRISQYILSTQDHYIYAW